MLIAEEDEFKHGILIDGDSAYYTADKAITINNYGDHYRIRLYVKTEDGVWQNVNQRLTSHKESSTPKTL